MLDVKNISYQIQGKKILDNIDLSIVPHKLNIVLGPNGAGKSTLFKLFSHAIEPSNGTIIFDSNLLSSYGATELSKKMIVMTQNYAMSLPFSVEEIVLMGRYPFFHTNPTKLDEQIVQNSMRELEIGHLKNRIFNSLSGGEQQRVQLARIFCQLYGSDGNYSHKILLLDEPTSAMDFYHQHLLLKKIKSLTDVNCTVVMILHDLQLCAQYADNIILLNNGKIEIQGNTDQVITENNLRNVYKIETTLLHDPKIHYPIIVPINN